MPLVTLSHRIPISVYPYKLRAWAWREDVDHIGRWRRANSDSNRDVGTEYRSAGQQHRCNQCCPHEAAHVVLTSHIIAEASTRRFAEVQGKTFLSRSGGFQQGVANTCGLDETGPWSSFIGELLGACRQATG